LLGRKQGLERNSPLLKPFKGSIEELFSPKTIPPIQSTNQISSLHLMAKMQ